MILVGLRLHYIEVARSDMNDFNQRYRQALESETLRAKWGDKTRRIESYWDSVAPAAESCSLDEETKRKWENDYQKHAGLTVDGEKECNKQMRRLREDMQAYKQGAIDRLGTYEDWAIRQSGLLKYHRWTRYPNDLRERIARGERGLMLGKIWEYML